jgi:hypothetical protein
MTEVTRQSPEYFIGIDPQQVYDVACEVAKWNIFGPWTPSSESWYRPEPGKPGSDSRVQVWHEDDGWCWRIGFGVGGLYRMQSKSPCATADDAKRAVDESLAECERAIFVPSPAAALAEHAPEVAGIAPDARVPVQPAPPPVAPHVMATDVSGAVNAERD